MTTETLDKVFVSGFVDDKLRDMLLCYDAAVSAYTRMILACCDHSDSKCIRGPGYRLTSTSTGGKGSYSPAGVKPTTKLGRPRKDKVVNNETRDCDVRSEPALSFGSDTESGLRDSHLSEDGETVYVSDVESHISLDFDDLPPRIGRKRACPTRKNPQK